MNPQTVMNAGIGLGYLQLLIYSIVSDDSVIVSIVSCVSCTYMFNAVVFAAVDLLPCSCFACV
jgi:hypothetical protein